MVLSPNETPPFFFWKQGGRADWTLSMNEKLNELLGEKF